MVARLSVTRQLLARMLILTDHPRGGVLEAMTHDPQQFPPLFHFDVSADSKLEDSNQESSSGELTALLRELVDGQDRQNHLLEELTEQISANQRQRAAELGQWKQANPELSKRCRKAAEALSRVQTEFLQNLIDEVTESADGLIDSDFMLNEFVDRFGPRLAHLNGVLQVLSQLSSVPAAPNSAQ